MPFTIHSRADKQAVPFSRHAAGYGYSTPAPPSHHQTPSTLHIPTTARPGWTLLRSYSTQSLDTLLSDLDRQREQCKRQPAKTTSSVHKLSQTLPKIFSRKSVARYYQRAKNGSMRSGRNHPPLPTNGAAEATSQTIGDCTAAATSDNDAQNDRHCAQNSNIHVPSLPLPPQARIHRADSRVQVQEAVVDVQPSTASIELVSYHQDDLQQGIHCFEQRDMAGAAKAFKHAGDRQVPAGMLLYGLALYHGWGCEICMPRAVQYVQQAIEHHADIKCLTSMSIITRAKITMAMQALGIGFRAGWGEFGRLQDTASALFRMAEHLDPTKDSPRRNRGREIRHSLSMLHAAGLKEEGMEVSWRHQACRCPTRRRRSMSI